MKKYWLILEVALIIYSLAPNVNAETNAENIINSQTDALGISTFLSDSKKYTEETFNEFDIGEIFTSSISRKNR